nr:unnamed protein product [Spirometra erinaceieuropaei]
MVTRPISHRGDARFTASLQPPLASCILRNPLPLLSTTFSIVLSCLPYPRSVTRSSDGGTENSYHLQWTRLGFGRIWLPANIVVPGIHVRRYACYDEVRRETNALRDSLQASKLAGLSRTQPTEFVYDRELPKRPNALHHYVDRKRPQWFGTELLGGKHDKDDS